MSCCFSIMNEQLLTAMCDSLMLSYCYNSMFLSYYGHECTAGKYGCHLISLSVQFLEINP